MTDQNKKSFKVLSPTAILGYGFPEDSFARGMEENPDLIAVDGGSADPGPHYLGVGKSFTNKEAVKRDLLIMIKAGLKSNIPFFIHLIFESPLFINKISGVSGKFHLTEYWGVAGILNAEISQSGKIFRLQS